jgi:hypothetical protein
MRSWRSRVIHQKIGSYDSYTLEAGDMVVVMGDVAGHRELLAGAGFEEHPQTKEYVGSGANLYALAPDAYYDLVAQATDGERFYQVDALPLVERGEDGVDRITRLTALDFETRKFIEEGVSNFRVG